MVSLMNLVKVYHGINPSLELEAYELHKGTVAYLVDLNLYVNSTKRPNLRHHSYWQILASTYVLRSQAGV